MFVDFNHVFKEKPISETKLPQAVLEQLNETLPKGIRYVSGDNSDVIMVGENGQVNLGGFTIIIPKEFKEVLGNHFRTDDILQLSYNAQIPLKIKLDHEGFLKINGQEVPIERVRYNIFNDAKYVKGSLTAYPQRFPEPTKLHLATENKKYSCDLKVYRKPYLSLDEVHFSTEEGKPLQLFYTLPNNINDGKVTLKLQLQNATTIREIVESIFIYNDFFERSKQKDDIGSNHRVFREKSIHGKPYDRKSALFWEKVLQVEEKLGVHFVPPEGDTGYQIMCDVEELYQSLICNKSFRENRFVSELTAEFHMEEGRKLEEAKGKELVFRYRREMEYEMFGVSFKIPAIIAVFHACVDQIEKMEGESVRLTFKETSQHAYSSIMCFESEEKLEEFVNAHEMDFMSLMENSRLVGELVDEQDSD